jgi:hypothetical protein
MSRPNLMMTKKKRKMNLNLQRRISKRLRTSPKTVKRRNKTRRMMKTRTMISKRNRG